MNVSRRARRMERHHRRARTGTGLNMVSLMDIFTILVFFLLVNSSDVETLPTAKSVKLPESVAQKMPKETVVVTVSADDVLVQGRRVAAVVEVLAAEGDVIGPLQAELERQARRLEATRAPPGEVTIMADKDIPYRLLRKIMVTCARAKYDNISLAVVRKESNI